MKNMAPKNAMTFHTAESNRVRKILDVKTRIQVTMNAGSEEMSVIRINDAIRQVGLDEQAKGMSEQS